MTLSCEDKVAILDNPLDQENPEYTPPQVTFVSPSPQESEIVESSEVNFQWHGYMVDEYRTKFDDGEWQDWTEETSATFQYLDEGPHIFSAQGRYVSGDTSAVVSINFSVDAVEGPALMFFPRRRIATTVGQTVAFQVMVEEVEDLSAVECTITFNPEILEVTHISEGSIFKSQGESIFLNNYDNDVGTITISSALLGGYNPSIDGTDYVAIIEMEIKKKRRETLTIDESAVFRNPNNKSISINEIINGLVEIEW